MFTTTKPFVRPSMIYCGVIWLAVFAWVFFWRVAPFSWGTFCQLAFFAFLCRYASQDTGDGSWRMRGANRWLLVLTAAAGIIWFLPGEGGIKERWQSYVAGFITLVVFRLPWLEDSENRTSWSPYRMKR